MRIKWKPLYLSLFFHVGSTIPWWRAKEILRANSGPIVSSDRPKISNITISQNSKQNEENFREKREKKCCSA